MTAAHCGPLTVGVGKDDGDNDGNGDGDGEGDREGDGEGERECDGGSNEDTDREGDIDGDGVGKGERTDKSTGEDVGTYELVLSREEVDAGFLGSLHDPSRSKRMSLFSTAGLAVQERCP